MAIRGRPENNRFHHLPNTIGMFKFPMYLNETVLKLAAGPIGAYVARFFFFVTGFFIRQEVSTPSKSSSLTTKEQQLDEQKEK